MKLSTAGVLIAAVMGSSMSVTGQAFVPALAAWPGNLSTFQIDPEMGAVTESYEGQSGKAAIFIQDAHAQYSAQKNIAKILNVLSENHELSLIGAEGFEGPADFSFFRAFPNQEAKEKVFDRAVAGGLTAGVEYFAVTHMRQPAVLGIDDEKLYARNVAQYVELSEKRKDFSGLLAGVRQSLRNLKSVVFSKEARGLDRVVWMYKHERAGLLFLLKQLKKRSVAAGVSPATYATLADVYEQMEKTAGADEKKKFKEAFLNIDGRLLAKELEDFIFSLQMAFAHTAAQREILELDDYYYLLERGGHLSLTREEMERLDARAKTRARRGFIRVLLDLAKEANVKIPALGDKDEAAAGDLKDEILEFYKTARARDRRFVERLIDAMNTYGRPAAVLVAGGFHTEGILHHLRKRSVSYKVIAPTMAEVSDQDRYAELMMRYGKLFSSDSGDVRAPASLERLETAHVPIAQAVSIRRGVIRSWVHALKNQRESPIILRSKGKIFVESAAEARAALKLLAKTGVSSDEIYRGLAARGDFIPLGRQVAVTVSRESPAGLPLTQTLSPAGGEGRVRGSGHQARLPVMFKAISIDDDDGDLSVGGTLALWKAQQAYKSKLTDELLAEAASPLQEYIESPGAEMSFGQSGRSGFGANGPQSEELKQQLGLNDEDIAIVREDYLPILERYLEAGKSPSEFALWDFPAEFKDMAREVSRTKLFRALYWLDPDYVGAIVSSVPHGRHTPLANLFQREESRVVKLYIDHIARRYWDKEPMNITMGGTVHQPNLPPWPFEPVASALWRVEEDKAVDLLSHLSNEAVAYVLKHIPPIAEFGEKGGWYFLNRVDKEKLTAALLLVQAMDVRGGSNDARWLVENIFEIRKDDSTDDISRAAEISVENRHMLERLILASANLQHADNYDLSLIFKKTLETLDSTFTQTAEFRIALDRIQQRMLELKKDVLSWLKEKQVTDLPERIQRWQADLTGIREELESVWMEYGGKLSEGAVGHFARARETMDFWVAFAGGRMDRSEFVDPRAVINDVLSSYPGGGLAEITFESFSNRKILSNSIGLGILMDNIIFNARTIAQQTRGQKGWVHVRLTDEGDDVVISIRNSGPRIKEKYLKKDRAGKPKIFETGFTRQIKERRGTGVGLAAVWAIAEHHGTHPEVINHPDESEDPYHELRGPIGDDEQDPLDTHPEAGVEFIVRLPAAKESKAWSSVNPGFGAEDFPASRDTGDQLHETPTKIIQSAYRQGKLEIEFYSEDQPVPEQISLEDIQNKALKEIDDERGWKQAQIEEARSAVLNFVPSFKAVRDEVGFDASDPFLSSQDESKVLAWLEENLGKAYFDQRFLFSEQLRLGENAIDEDIISDFVDAVIEAYKWSVDTSAFLGSRRHRSVTHSEGEEEAEQENSESQEAEKILDVIDGLMKYDIADNTFSILADTRHPKARAFLYELLRDDHPAMNDHNRQSLIANLIDVFNDTDLVPFLIQHIKKYPDRFSSRTAFRGLMDHVHDPSVKQALLDYVKDNFVDAGDLVDFLIQELPLEEIPGWLKAQVRYLSEGSREDFDTIGAGFDEHRFKQRMIALRDHLALRETGLPPFQYETDQFVFRSIRSHSEYLIMKRIYRVTLPKKGTAWTNQIHLGWSPWNGTHFVLIEKSTGNIVGGVEVEIRNPDEENLRPFHLIEHIGLSGDLEQALKPYAYEAILAGVLKTMEGRLQGYPVRLRQSIMGYFMEGLGRLLAEMPIEQFISSGFGGESQNEEPPTEPSVGVGAEGEPVNAGEGLVRKRLSDGEKKEKIFHEQLARWKDYGMLIDRRASALYREAREVFDLVLENYYGLDPKTFELDILLTDEENAFIFRERKHVFITRGFMKALNKRWGRLTRGHLAALFLHEVAHYVKGGYEEAKAAEEKGREEALQKKRAWISKVSEREQKEQSKGRTPGYDGGQIIGREEVLFNTTAFRTIEEQFSAIYDLEMEKESSPLERFMREHVFDFRQEYHANEEAVLGLGRLGMNPREEMEVSQFLIERDREAKERSREKWGWLWNISLLAAHPRARRQLEEEEGIIRFRHINPHVKPKPLSREALKELDTLSTMERELIQADPGKTPAGIYVKEAASADDLHVLRHQIYLLPLAYPEKDYAYLRVMNHPYDWWAKDGESTYASILAAEIYQQIGLVGSVRDRTRAVEEEIGHLRRSDDFARTKDMEILASRGEALYEGAAGRPANPLVEKMEQFLLFYSFYYSDRGTQLFSKILEGVQANPSALLEFLKRGFPAPLEVGAFPIEGWDELTSTRFNRKWLTDRWAMSQMERNFFTIMLFNAINGDYLKSRPQEGVRFFSGILEWMENQVDTFSYEIVFKSAFSDFLIEAVRKIGLARMAGELSKYPIFQRVPSIVETPYEEMIIQELEKHPLPKILDLLEALLPEPSLARDGLLIFLASERRMEKSKHAARMKIFSLLSNTSDKENEGLINYNHPNYWPAAKPIADLVKSWADGKTESMKGKMISCINFAREAAEMNLHSSFSFYWALTYEGFSMFLKRANFQIAAWEEIKEAWQILESRYRKDGLAEEDITDALLSFLAFVFLRKFASRKQLKEVDGWLTKAEADFKVSKLKYSSRFLDFEKREFLKREWSDFALLPEDEDADRLSYENLWNGTLVKLLESAFSSRKPDKANLVRKMLSMMHEPYFPGQVFGRPEKGGKKPKRGEAREVLAEAYEGKEKIDEYRKYYFRFLQKYQSDLKEVSLAAVSQDPGDEEKRLSALQKKGYEIITESLADQSLRASVGGFAISDQSSLDLILEAFHFASFERDRALSDWLGEGAGERTIDRAARVIPHLKSLSLRLSLGQGVYERSRKNGGGAFQTLLGELNLITSLFPDPSPARDQHLDELVTRHVRTEEDYGHIADLYMRQSHATTTRKAALFHSAALEAIRDYIESDRVSSLERALVFLWMLGVVEKPHLVEVIEQALGYRSTQVQKGVESITTYERRELIRTALLGDYGILSIRTEDGRKAKKLFIAYVFRMLMGEKANLNEPDVRRFYLFFDTLFHFISPERQLKTLTALFEAKLGDAGSEERMKVFVEALDYVGIKAAQYLASNTSVLSPAMRDQFLDMTSRVKPPPKGEIFPLLKETYGYEDFPEYFQSLGHLSGSASLNMAYDAALWDGTELILLIQRQDVVQGIRGALDEAADVGTMAVELPDRYGIEISRALIPRIREQTLREMDNVQLVSNFERLHENAAGWNQDPKEEIQVFVPRVIKEHKGKILTQGPIVALEKAPGLTLDRAEKELGVEAVLPYKRRLAKLLIKQVFGDGFFHADPHPGNILIDHENRAIYLIDAGIASAFSEENRRTFLQFINGLLAGGGFVPELFGIPEVTFEDMTKTVRDFIVRSQPNPRSPAVKKKIDALVHELTTGTENLALGLKKQSDIVYEIIRRFDRYGLSLDQEVFYFFRMLSLSEYLLKTLTPLEFLNEIFPYLKNLKEEGKLHARPKQRIKPKKEIGFKLMSRRQVLEHFFDPEAQLGIMPRLWKRWLIHPTRIRYGAAEYFMTRELSLLSDNEVELISAKTEAFEPFAGTEDFFQKQAFLDALLQVRRQDLENFGLEIKLEGREGVIRKELQRKRDGEPPLLEFFDWEERRFIPLIDLLLHEKDIGYLASLTEGLDEELAALKAPAAAEERMRGEGRGERGENSGFGAQDLSAGETDTLVAALYPESHGSKETMDQFQRSGFAVLAERVPSMASFWNVATLAAATVMLHVWGSGALYLTRVFLREQGDGIVELGFVQTILIGIAVYSAVEILWANVQRMLGSLRHSYLQKRFPFPAPRTFIEEARAHRFDSDQLVKWFIESSSRRELFDKFAAAPLLDSAVEYHPRAFQLFAVQVWNALGIDPLERFPSSPIGEKFGLGGKMVEAGGRRFHIIGIAHGIGVVLNERKVRALVEYLSSAGIPLYSEENFRSHYGYSYGSEILDHRIDSKGSNAARNLRGLFSTLFHLPVFFGFSLFLVFSSAQRYFERRIGSTIDRPDYLDHTRSDRSRGSYMASAAYDDDSGKKDVVFLMDGAHRSTAIGTLTARKEKEESLAGGSGLETGPTGFGTVSAGFGAESTASENAVPLRFVRTRDLSASETDVLVAAFYPEIRAPNESFYHFRENILRVDYALGWQSMAVYAGGALVGLVRLILRDEKTGIVQHVHVLPSARGRDLGYRMVTQALKQMREQGKTKFISTPIFKHDLVGYWRQVVERLRNEPFIASAGVFPSEGFNDHYFSGTLVPLESPTASVVPTGFGAKDSEAEAARAGVRRGFRRQALGPKLVEELLNRGAAETLGPIADEPEIVTKLLIDAYGDPAVARARMAAEKEEILERLGAIDFHTLVISGKTQGIWEERFALVRAGLTNERLRPLLISKLAQVLGLIENISGGESAGIVRQIRRALRIPRHRPVVVTDYLRNLTNALPLKLDLTKILLLGEVTPNLEAIFGSDAENMVSSEFFTLIGQFVRLERIAKSFAKAA